MRLLSILYLLLIGLDAYAYDERGDEDKKGNNSDYKLVWQDEFEYNGVPDPSKWSFETHGNDWGWGNNELQYYTDQEDDNAWVSEGILHLRAEKETIADKNYTSARLVTKDKGDWKYGKMEIRAKVPKGRGLWSAIWMMPTKSTYGEWPASGEIDIMEHVGFSPDTIHTAIHTKDYNHMIGTEKTVGVEVDNIYEEFHLYTLEWSSDSCVMLIDGNECFSFRKENNDPDKWPFDKSFYLILNVAVGGNWGGMKGIDDSIFPQVMEVDYVRVYQKK
jgi:beta-glucanase (GH16 family)